MKDKKIRKMLFEALKDEYEWDKLDSKDRQSIEDMVNRCYYSIIQDYPIKDTWQDLLIVLYESWKVEDKFLINKYGLIKLTD